MMSLLPKEHGAYGQLTFPLLTSFAVAGVSVPSALIACAVVAAFLAHEPLLILLGGRGPRAKREDGRRARMWLAVAVAVVIVVGADVAALASRAFGVRGWLLLPLVPAVFVAAAVIARREKSALGEIAVALTFSLIAVPICVASGAPPDTALAVGVAFAIIFVAATLSVRAIVLKVRAGGNARASSSTRAALWTFAVASTAGLVTSALRGILPWTVLLAVAPGLVAAMWLTSFPPPPARLRTVGWTLIAISTAATLILIGGLSGNR
jgi:YwiC-like protein